MNADAAFIAASDYSTLRMHRIRSSFMIKKQLLLAVVCAATLGSISGCAVISVAGAAVTVASTAVSVGVTAGSVAVKGVTAVGGAVLGGDDDDD